MQQGALTNYVDVAQIALYVFWLAFAAIIYYLLQENKREGYPLITERKNIVVQGFPFVPAPKTFLMPNGHKILAPRYEAPETFNGVPSANFPGAPYEPVGNPMLSGMGPGAWARRADEPDLAWDDNLPKIVPLRAAPAFFLAWEDPDLTGFDVVGLDGVVAGKIVDSWVDRSEVVLRYVEVELTHPKEAKRILLPIHYMTISKKQKHVRSGFITGAQFADVPATRNAETVTLLEEDKILAYYSAGMLYARSGRMDPLI